MKKIPYIVAALFSLTLFAFVGVVSTASANHVRTSFVVEESDPIAGEPTNIYSTSAPAEDITNYTWEINGEVVSAGSTAEILYNNTANKTYTFSEAGSYNIKLITLDKDGDVTSSSKNITVIGSVDIRNLSCVISGYDISCSSLVSSGYRLSDLKYEWDFGDGVVREGSQGTGHTYSGPGTYELLLTVSHPDGVFDLERYNVVVEEGDSNKGPRADFTWTPQNPRVGQNITFTFTGVPRGATIDQVKWYINGSFKTDGIGFSHTFEEAGVYEVAVIAEDVDGYQGRVERNVEVSAGDSGGTDNNGDRDTITGRTYDVNTDYGKGGLVPCDGINCTFADFIELLNRVITWIFYTAAVVATVMFAYAGWLYMSSGGNPQKISTAHNIFKKTAIGLIIIALAWLIVNTITSTLLDTDNGFWTILK